MVNSISSVEEFEKIYWDYYQTLEKEFLSTENFLAIDEINENAYSIAYMNLGQINEAEKYLKIANQINPVSAPILIRLCEFYQSKHEE